MKILHVIHHYHEGFGYQENWLAAHQLRQGHQVRVVTSDYYFPFPNYDSTMGPTLGIRHVGAGQYTDGDVTVIRKASKCANIGPPGVIWFPIKDELNDFEPDVIHLHGATSPLLFSLVRHQKKLGYEIFVDSHQDPKVEGASDTPVYRAYYAMWRYLFHQRGLKHRVARFLPITQAAQKWLEDKLNLSPDCMTISPLGVDLESMSLDTSARQRFRNEHKLDDHIVLVNAGKQYPAKRIDWVIEVAQAAGQRGVPIALILVGSADSDYDALIETALAKSEIRTLRLPFLDRAKLCDVYSAADIGIWPGIPSNTIQEAMACGCAMVLPDDDIVGHLIEGNGIATASDTNAAAEYITSLHRDPVKLEQAQTASIAMAKRYSWAAISSDLTQLYAEFKALNGPDRTQSPTR